HHSGELNHRNDPDVSDARIAVLPVHTFGPVSTEMNDRMLAAAAALSEIVATLEHIEAPNVLQTDFDALTRRSIGVETNQFYTSVLEDRHADLHHSLRSRLVLPEATFTDYQ